MSLITNPFIICLIAIVLGGVIAAGISCCTVAKRADKIEEEYWEHNAEHCVVCGKVIPEGRMVCIECETKTLR